MLNLGVMIVTVASCPGRFKGQGVTPWARPTGGWQPGRRSPGRSAFRISIGGSRFAEPYCGRSKALGMADDVDIRKRLLLRTMGSPLVLGPFLMGATTATASWALGWRPEFSAFAVLAGALASVGMFLTRLLVGGEKIARDLTEEAALRQQRADQRSLDELDRHLTEVDVDPRPESALRDLRALLRAFEEAEGTAVAGHLPMVVELHQRARQLFQQCVQSLVHSGRLWQTAQGLATAAARKPLLAQRERIIEDVQGTVKQLSETLVSVQSLGTDATTGSSRELRRLRQELDQSLDVARTVEERVATLLNDSGGPLPADLLQTKNSTQT